MEIVVAEIGRRFPLADRPTHYLGATVVLSPSAGPAMLLHDSEDGFPVLRNLEGRRFPPELSRCAQEHTEVVGIRTHRIGLESPLSEVITEPRAQVLQCVNGELFEGDVQET